MFSNKTNKISKIILEYSTNIESYVLDKIPKDLNAIMIRLSDVAKILAHRMNKVRKVWDPRNLMHSDSHQ